ncbi:1439_t:CDS:10 [Entrophospora sp. SA101]|nr:1439_t:CDS:10 [Entrophospora sp. SA101]
MTIKGRQLFVGNLPVVGWQELKGHDDRSRGQGIVLYTTVADAQEALSKFDGYEWHGRKLEVREDRSVMDFSPSPSSTESNASNETTTTYLEESTNVHNSAAGTSGTNVNSSNLQRQLFVGNLPFRVRWQDLKDLFRKAGTVLRADVVMGYDNRSKGHGTVLFANVEDAKKAIGKSANNNAMYDHYNWQGRNLDVREDRSFMDPNNSNNQNSLNKQHRRIHHDPMINSAHLQSPFPPGAQIVGPAGIFYGHTRGIHTPQSNFAGRLLFVGNLPFNCQWQDLKDLFRNAGNIIRADVSTNYDGRSRGFGTVLFATSEDARNAVSNMSHHPNFHIAPPPPPPIHHPHFMATAHLGPFSPPLATPTLASPPFHQTSYNPLAAHMSNNINNATNGTSPFQQIPMVTSANSIHGLGSSAISQDQPITTSTSQFPGFGPIGGLGIGHNIHHGINGLSSSGGGNAITNGLGNVVVHPQTSKGTVMSLGMSTLNGMGVIDGKSVSTMALPTVASQSVFVKATI